MELWKEEYLVHHGVLGMKWGVRRYQNYDGTRIGTFAKRKSKSIMSKQYKDKRLKATMVKDDNTGEHIGVLSSTLKRKGKEVALQQARDKDYINKIRDIQSKYFDKGYKYLLKKTGDKQTAYREAVNSWMEVTGYTKTSAEDFIRKYSKVV